ncbi:MAG: hypothetical protein WCR87_01915 [Saccharofermentanales bacterium]
MFFLCSRKLVELSTKARDNKRSTIVYGASFVIREGGAFMLTH